jgi:hypothetical protein
MRIDYFQTILVNILIKKRDFEAFLKNRDFWGGLKKNEKTRKNEIEKKTRF